MEDGEEDDFNRGLILPPLLVQLKKILEQYPDDTQILKELIQNAEDAGARTVKFLYDRHTFSRDARRLQHPQLVEYQMDADGKANNRGPALYSYNDGMFDEEDWTGIRMLSQSVKHDDPLKVGYFGMGFKSVFHLTDLPYILSGDRLGVIDPHEKFFKATTYSWNYNKKPELLKQYRSHFEPFLGVFDCKQEHLDNGFYKGSIFRFPLRTKESALSDKIYNAERMERLFDGFEADSHLLLLFLKSMELIQMYDRNSYQAAPKLLFEVRLSDDCVDYVRHKRREFIQRTRGRTWKDEPIHTSFAVTIETVRYEKLNPTRKRYKYLVTNYFAGGQSSAIFRKLCADPELHNSPCVGAAMPLDLEAHEDEIQGHVFCFLPLPVEQKSLTGLPVHLNGFFALEHNRKHVKWPSLYRTTMRDDLMDKRLLWNQCLLREALPRAYTALLLDAIQRHQDDPQSMPLETIYHAFPNFSNVDRRWEAILLPLFTELFKYPVIHTKSGDGGWVEAREAVLDTLPDNEVKSVILSVLDQGSIRVASVPQHILDAVRRCYHHGFNRVTPALIAQTIKQHIQVSSHSVQYNFTLDWQEKLALLRYFLSDSKYDLLDGLEMLPLANGGFTTFTYNPRKAERPIYIATMSHPRSLLPGLDDDFLDPELDEDLLEMLCRAARRGYTQLRLLDAETVVLLLPRVLPPTWRDASQVTWDPKQYGHPPSGWLKELWLYLLKQHQNSLSIFEKLPIIPAKSHGNDVYDLVPLGTHRALICREHDGMILSDRVAAILKKLDISVIDELPTYIKAHPLVTRKYTFTPTHIGILKSFISLSNIQGLTYLLERIAELSNEEKLEVRRLFSKISPHELRGEYRDFLRHMPLFETMKNENGESDFVSVEFCNLAAPKDLPALPLSQRLLSINASDAQNLAGILHVTQLTQLELFTTIVFSDIERGWYDNDQVQSVMLYVLRQYHNFQGSSVSFRDTLRQLAFIPRKDSLATPSRFYDPEHDLLQRLFSGEENFPHGKFSEPSILAVLREIGLRGPKDIEAGDLLGTALTVEEKVKNDQEMRTLLNKADALLEFLIKNPSMLDRVCDDDAPLFERLKTIRFIRIVDTKPTLYPASIPWYATKKKPGTSLRARTDLAAVIECPVNVTSHEFANVIGSVMPVVAVETSHPVTYAFGWHVTPALEKVVQHFSNVTTSYTGRDKAKLSEMVQSCYQVFTQHEAEDVLTALEQHHVERWIWHGDGFCSHTQIVLDDPFMDLAPFVYLLPVGLDNMTNWLVSCGVKQKCDLYAVLQQVKDKHKPGSEFSESEVRRDLNICISVLNELKNSPPSKHGDSVELVVPVHAHSSRRLRLEPISRCSFSDEEWVRQGHDLADLNDDDVTADDDNLLLVHPNVPSSTSEALGVPTLMSRMLEAEELDFSFGQSDSLTHRLSTLLQDYTDGFAVFKELLQNADDAGATEIKFLYDERENEDAMTCLIDEGMRGCQGPALWIYNDAVFQDDDFDNICKLSGATKESHTDKIGRFGLGFNAVYNLTDVPSFVSRNSIVIFDPHTTHLGRSIKNKSKPGIRIDMRKHRRKLRRIGNQFKPYNDIFGCDLRPDAETESYNGTLFRLPLRTKAQAVNSEICQKHYDDNEMKSLLSMLVTNAEALLLFTQNVTKVALYHLGKNVRGPQEMVQMLSVEKKPVEVVRELLPKVEVPVTAHKLSDDMKKMIQQSSILRSASKVLKSLKLGHNIARLDVPSSSQIVEIEQLASKSLTHKFGLQASHCMRQWLISSYMARQEALHMAAQENNLSPCAGVAVPVTKSPDHDSYTPVPILNKSYPRNPCGAIFAYMPLPVISGLPVHLNGALAISSSRRHLCERNEDDKFDIRALWNETLMRDGVCNAYLNLLQDLSIISPPNEFGYPELWPNLSHTETIVKPLMDVFYKQMLNAKKPVTVFSDANTWRSIQHAQFLSPELEANSAAHIALKVARQCTKHNEDVILYLPEFIKRGFQAAGHDREIQQRTVSMKDFYQNMFLANIVNVNPIERDSLVLQALSMGNTQILALLKTSRCIPVTPKGDSLKCPHELIDPASELAILFSPEDKRFPYGVFQERNTLEVLRQLGLKSERISWTDIVACAKSMKTVPFATAQKRIPVLLKQVEKNIHASDNEKEIKDNVAQLRSIPFLLPMRKPDYFPIAWRGDTLKPNTLLSPNDLHHPVHKDVVCFVEPVLDTSAVPSECQSAIDCLSMSSRDPNVDSVLEQLEVLADTENEACLADNRIFKDVHRICNAVYELLQYRCDHTETKAKIISRLKDKPIFLCHGKFLSANQLAFNFTQNCPPYLYSVPDTLAKNYDRFLRVMGVRDNFEARDYVQALQDMHTRYGDEVLKKDTLKLALQLVNLLNDVMTEASQNLQDVAHDQGTIYIPDANGILHPSHDLCFNEPDCAWVPSARYTTYSHPLIPFTISKQLGVNTKRHDMLSKHSTGIGFGQKERLTNRIRRILSGYPCDKEILKELLQNADDAGATEITFINDPRTHRAERVFDESWKPLQGPALLVYNDAAFRERDIAGIQRLGEGSKALDPNSTGQYGVGFNCVYHLTDAPCFLTKGDAEVGETLCVFDPHAKYVPGATSEEPGRRFNDVSRIRPIFTDVFPCFLEKSFPVHKGTMFRFPLRTQEMAEQSELSDKPINSKDVSALFSKFRSEMFDCLMYVNSVSSITLCDIDPKSGQPINRYSVCADLSAEDHQIRKEFSQFITSTTAKLKNGTMQVWNVPTKEVTYTLNLTDSNGYYEQWLVHQRIGFEEGTEISAALSDSFKRHELSLLPRGGAAALLNRDENDPTQPGRQCRAFCFLPLPIKTGLPVSVNGHFALDHEARRNLWSDETDRSAKSEWNEVLLKHVIAPAYVELLVAAQKHLSVNSIGASKASANSSFMQQVDEEVPGIERYSDLFPRLTNTEQYVTTLVKGVYQHMHNSGSRVLPVVRTSHDKSLNDSHQAEVLWMSTLGQQTPYFDCENMDDSSADLSLSFNSSIANRRHMAMITSTPKKPPARLLSERSPVQRLKQALIECGLKLVRLPVDIYDCFSQSGVPVERLCSRVVVDFFRSFDEPGSSCQLGSVPVELKATPLADEQTMACVLQYSMKDSEYLMQNLEGLPLLLTADGNLRIFTKKQPVYLTEYTDLLPECCKMFMHSSLSKTAFSSIDPDDYSVFTRFDVYAFASLLPDVLSEAWYRKENEHAEWIQNEGELPTPDWIWQVWNFLRAEYERILEDQGEDVVIEDVVRGVLKPLEEWCLLPAHLQDIKAPKTPTKSMRVSFYSTSESDVTDQYLVPIGLTHTVLDFSQTSVVNFAFRKAVRNLGLPELSHRLLDGGAVSPHGKNTSPSSSNSNFARVVVGNMEKPITVLQALAFAKDNGKLESLNSEEAGMILKYFNDCCDAWRDQKECILMLRDLPIFPSIRGGLEAIRGNTAYVLPLDIPQIDLEIWEKDAEVLFLRRNAAIEELYNAIGCVSLTASQVYSQFTFQNFGRLSDKGRIKHLEFIRDIKLPQLQGDEKKAFTDNLKSLRFLQDSIGKFKRACDYYDPYNPVFKAMFGKDSSLFPPKPFNEFKWLEFMKMVGLNHTVTPEQFVDYARQVADEAVSNPSEETFNKSRTLVVHLFTRPQVANEGLLEQLTDVPFIPAAKVNSIHAKLSPTYAEVCGDKMPYMRFKDGIPEAHEALVWTCAFLLPDWANPNKLTVNEVSWEYEEDTNLSHFKCYRQRVAHLLGITEEPTIEDVVRHAKNIIAHASRGTHSVSDNQDADVKAYMRVEVMKTIYKCLQDRALNSDVARQLLEGEPFLLVDLGYTFVRTEQVVIELYEDDQIAPFLYKLPTELGEFKKLFMHLGATENATAKQYAMVLEKMYNSTYGAKLHPNELRTAFKAVHELFTALKRRHSDDLGLERIYLPSDTGCLQPSTDLAFNNFPAFSERIKTHSIFDRQFLVDLSECGLTSKSQIFEDIIRLLPRRLRPPKLTSLVTEKLEDISANSVVSYGLCEKIRHQFTSRAFSAGVLRLIKHEHNRAGHRIKKEVFDEIQRTLKNIRVYGVQTLITYLRYDGERIMDSESQCECFADKTPNEHEEGDIWCIYIDNGTSFNEELLVNLAELVNRIIGGLLTHSIHYLQPIFSCAPHSIYRVLDKLKVRPDHSIDFKQPTLPTPGSFVPIEDHHLLNEDFNEFEVGEYVAYEIDDDDSLESGGQTFVYAIIVEKILLEEHDDSRGSRSEYPRVHLSQKYTINIGDERKPVEAMATDLYKFHRVEGFVSRSGSTSRSDRHRHLSESTQSPHGSFRDAAYSFSESLYEPQTPKTPHSPIPPKSARRLQSRDEVFSSTPAGQRTAQRRRAAAAPNGAEEEITVKVQNGGTPFHNEPEPEPEATTTGRRRRGHVNRYKTRATARDEPTFEDIPQPDAFDGSYADMADSRSYFERFIRKEDEENDEYRYEEGVVYDYEEEMGPPPAPGDELQPYVERPEYEYTQTDGGAAGSGGAEQRERAKRPKPPPGTIPEPGDAEDKTPEEVLNEVSDCLEEAWTLPESQRKKIIKRLLLKWHPDKNIGNEQFSTMITQHIGKEIERLELGLPRPEQFEDLLNEFKFDARNPFSQSETFQKNFYSAYQFFFDQVNQRAKEHKQQRERYKEYFAREYSSSRARDFDNFDVPPSFSSSNPQPNQAKRFLRQAQEDLRAADNDYDTKEPAFEWTCFKSHQAAEKALKAAQFSVDASTSFSHDLAVLAATIEDLELRRLAIKLQGIIGNASKLYNPDPIDFVIIPHEEYSKEMACDAQMCASDILERVKEFVELRE